MGFSILTQQDPSGEEGAEFVVPHPHATLRHPCVRVYACESCTGYLMYT